MKKLEKISGLTLLAIEVIAAILIIAAQGFAGAFATAGRLFQYGLKVLADLGNPKYATLLIVLVVSIIVAVVLFVVNLKKKKAFFLAPSTVPMAVGLYYVFYRYRHLLQSDNMIKKIAEIAIIALFALVVVYALATTIEILFGKKKAAAPAQVEETKEEAPVQEEAPAEEPELSEDEDLEEVKFENKKTDSVSKLNKLLDFID